MLAIPRSMGRRLNLAPGERNQLTVYARTAEETYRFFINGTEVPLTWPKYSRYRGSYEDRDADDPYVKKDKDYTYTERKYSLVADQTTRYESLCTRLAE